MKTSDISDLQVIQAYAEWTRYRLDCPDEILALKLNAPPKVVYRSMERVAAKGYVDYGVSLRTGWLTDKGKAIIGLMR